MWKSFLLSVGCAAAIVIVVGGCTSGDGAITSPGNSSNDQGPLEPEEVTQARDFRITSFAGGNYLLTIPDAELLPLDESGTYPGRLRKSAVRHTGYLASEDATTTSPTTNVFDTTEVPGTQPGPSNLPLFTDTLTPDPDDTPPYPGLFAENPLNRLIRNAWGQENVISPTWPWNATNELPFPGGIDPAFTAKYNVHEFELALPFVPDVTNSGSRMRTAFYNRIGRLGLMRNNSAYFNYGSILEARAWDLDVLLEGLGTYLGGRFRGTFIYLVDKTIALTARVSFFPGHVTTGSAPIVYGWAYDPYTGAETGIPIHASGDAPLQGLVTIDLQWDGTWDPFENKDHFTFPGPIPISPPISFLGYHGRVPPPAVVALPPNTASGVLQNPPYAPHEIFFVPSVRLKNGSYKVTVTGVPWFIVPRYFCVWNEIDATVPR
jgi:hypothetical protein